MFYVEGNIDSIELETDGPKLRRFSLMPSPEFLVAQPNGTKRVLLLDYYSGDDCRMNVAILVKGDKNENDKKVLFFKPHDSWTFALIDILIQAKCTHSKVRVCISRMKSKRKDAISYPNFEGVIEVHLI